MRPDPWMPRLYATVAALLLAHEIDSAYWHEWTLFHLGDEAFFVLIHVPLVIAIVWGYGKLRDGDAWGDRMALLLAVTGVAALFIHSGFILAGANEFRTPVSLALIAVMAACSLALGVLVVRRLAGARAARAGLGRRQA